jgi:two-component system OmpR family response regulator
MPETSFSLRVLLVDDCSDMRASISTLLRVWGYEVCTAADGPAGLTAAEDFRPHVVLLDVGLPGMDGFEVARRLRDRPTEPPPSIVTLSGYGLEEDFQRSRIAGCDRHLVKPVDLLDLRLMLAQYAELVRRPRGQEVS